MLVLMQCERPMALHRTKYYESPIFFPFQEFPNVGKDDVLIDFAKRQSAFNGEKDTEDSRKVVTTARPA
jgi:hypothetical protein